MKRMRAVSLMLGIAAAVALSGCAAMRQTLGELRGETEPPNSDPTQAGLVILDFDIKVNMWIMGEVHLDVSGATIRSLEPSSKDLDASQVSLGFLRRDSPGVLFHGLRPGRYRVTRLRGSRMETNAGTRTTRSIPYAFDVSDQDALAFDLEAGKPLYVGKFIARAHGHEMHYSWETTPRREIEVWRAIEKKYPDSPWIPAIDRRIAALQEPPGLAPRDQENPGRLVVREESWPAEAMGEWRSLVVSPDRLHLAYWERRSGGYRLERDGRKGKTYEGVRNAVFSPDGSRLGHVASRGERQFVVVDEVRGKEYRLEEGPNGDGILSFAPVFSPDGKHVAYAVQQDQRHFVVVDEREGKPYERIVTHDPVFSSDGMHVAYVAERSGRQLVVVDDREGEEYEGINQRFLRLGRDGNRIAYAATRGGRRFVVVDGKRGREYEAITDTLVLSPDGKRVAHGAQRGGKQLVVVDEREGPEYDEIGDLRFSPDGGRVAYRARRGGRWLVVIEGQEGREYESVAGLRLGPDGTRAAFSAQEGGRWRVVIDGEEGQDHDGVDDPVFSPDGRRVAYPARRGEKWRVVVDGVEGNEYDEIKSEHLTFSPDGRRLAYAARRGTSALIVVDGNEGKPYELIVPRLDGRVILYSKQPFEDLEMWPKPVFDGPDALHALAYRSEQFVRVEMAWE